MKNKNLLSKDPEDNTKESLVRLKQSNTSWKHGSSGRIKSIRSSKYVGQYIKKSFPLTFFKVHITVRNKSYSIAL